MKAKQAQASNGIHDDTDAAGSPEALWSMVKPASQMTHLSKLKVMVYGPSGSGKTRMVSLFKKPLVGVTELQGIPTIQQWNPQALIFPIQTSEDLSKFRRIIRDPALPEKVDAVCLDSVTDLQRIIKAAYVAKQTSNRELPDMDTWGLIVDRTARMVREVRDLPVHVMVTCLDVEQSVPGEGIVHRPAVQGRTLPGDLAQYFNLVGYSFSKQYEKGVRHEVLFRGSERYMIKGMPGIDDVEAPEPTMWIAKRFDEAVDKNVQHRLEKWTAIASTDTEQETQKPEADPFGNPN